MTERNQQRYETQTIEAKWQAYWEAHQTFRTEESGAKPKAYILDMFPYPSGAGLHVGHPEGYTATDIIARFRRAQGYCVLHPMGWDAFGLPAEQHAIRTGTHPRETTVANIANFRRQLKALGFSYDWSREIDTTSPDYVRFTQWIFLKLFERGLAYQQEVPVNWCAELGTVLANEEVKDGLSEVGGYPVTRVPLRQWVLRITAYADRLLDDLSLNEWPASTKQMQEAWIGRSRGCQVRFAVDQAPQVDGDEPLVLDVFTTRPDTLFGVTYLALAPEHPHLKALTAADQANAVAAYVEAARHRSDLDRKAAKTKSGVPLGTCARHPLSGEPIPLWVADYVLGDYGSGAVMGVPAHDERDFDFATICGLPIKQVIVRDDPTRAADIAPPGVLDAAVCEPGRLVNSAEFSGLTSDAASEAIAAALEAASAGKVAVQYKLRDWVFARQRYWGEPIPILFPVETTGDPRAGADYRIDYSQPIALNASELPLTLPDLEDFRPGSDPAGALARALDWRFVQRDGRWFARETNTMPQWAGSCWYYLRFIDPHNPKCIADPTKLREWLPVDLYVGGAEHAVLHLLYARFWHKVLFDVGAVPTPEPFAKLVHQGMILGEVEYGVYRDATGQPVSRTDVDLRADPPVRRADSAPLSLERVAPDQVTKNKRGDFELARDAGVVLEARAHKMSKSRGNVVSPDEIIQSFGADSMRLYEMFMGPLEATKPWNTQNIQGVRRLVDRAYQIARSADRTLRVEDCAESEALTRALHRTVRKVTEDIEALRFNTAISALMVLTQTLQDLVRVPQAAAETLALLMHPFAPHLGEEMWACLGHPPSIQSVPWPSFDPALCESDTIEVPVQINGKVRGRLTLRRGLAEAEVLAQAQSLEAVALNLEGKALIKTVWVPDKILTLVVR